MYSFRNYDWQTGRLTDRPTDRPTNQLTDIGTDWAIGKFHFQYIITKQKPKSKQEVLEIARNMKKSIKITNGGSKKPSQLKLCFFCPCRPFHYISIYVSAYLRSCVISPERSLHLHVHWASVPEHVCRTTNYVPDPVNAVHLSSYRCIYYGRR